jgi:hypothetical protein
MVRKPWMGIWEQDNNVMHIFERMFHVLMPELYMKLFRARIILECNSVCEVINNLVDADVIAHLNDEYRSEFEHAAHSETGKEYNYGAKSKSSQHRTPDSFARDQRIKFDEYDKELAESEAQDG